MSHWLSSPEKPQGRFLPRSREVRLCSRTELWLLLCTLVWTSGLLQPALPRQMRSQRGHMMHTDHLGSIVQVFTGPLLCLNSGPRFSDPHPSSAAPAGLTPRGLWLCTFLGLIPVLIDASQSWEACPSHHRHSDMNTHFPTVSLHWFKITLSFLSSRTRSFFEPNP